MTRWRWVLLALLLFGLALVGGLALLVQSLVHWAGEGVHVSVNGETLPVDGLSLFSALEAACGLLLAVVIVLCVVPLAVAMALGAAALAIGGVLLALLLVVALLLSPLWLLLALLWWALRPARPRPPAAA